MGVGEISQITGYTKSTVSRLLSTFEKHGCVERAGGPGKYRLGYRVYLWGVISCRQNNLIAIAKPVMEQLRDKCGEEVALYVVEGQRRLCVERVASVHEIAKVAPVGSGTSWNLLSVACRCFRQGTACLFAIRKAPAVFPQESSEKNDLTYHYGYQYPGKRPGVYP